MNGDRFRTAYNISESHSAEESENPFRNIHATKPTNQVASQILEGKENKSASLQASTRLLQGDLSVTKNSLNFSVPIEFLFSGRKFLISISSSVSAQGVKLDYVINSGDKSSLRIVFITGHPTITIAPSPGPRKQYGKIIVKFDTTNKVGNKASVTLVYGPDLEKLENTVNDFRQAIKNLEGTDLWTFVKAFPFFDSTGPINPKSVLEKPAILFGSILRPLGIGTRSLIDSEIEGSETELSTWDKRIIAAKCGLGVLSCLVGVAVAIETGGLAGYPAALNCIQGAGVDCIDAVKKLGWLDAQPTPQPSQPTPQPSQHPICSAGQYWNPGLNSCEPLDTTPQIICGPGQKLDPTGAWGGTCVPDIPIGPPAPPPRPRATLTQEQIRWVQTILKAAGGESGLKIDGIIGPQTREALRRFQRRFSLIVDGLLSLQTATALTQLALNHMAKQSRLAVDGIMGPKTRAEVKMFQSTHDSGPIDGIVGPKTRAAMAKVLLSEIPSELIPEISSEELYQVSEDNTEKWYPL